MMPGVWERRGGALRPDTMRLKVPLRKLSKLALDLEGEILREAVAAARAIHGEDPSGERVTVPVPPPGGRGQMRGGDPSIAR